MALSFPLSKISENKIKYTQYKMVELALNCYLSARQAISTLNSEYLEESLIYLCFKLQS